MRFLIAVFVSFACALGAQEPAFRPAPARNVLLITFDDLRQDTPGFNGGPAKTPQMDRLAAVSANFKNAMTTVGLCSPSRATLFTGRYGHQTGLDDNVFVWHSRLTNLSYRETTLIEWAREAGYFTGYFGKWHLGPDGPIRRGAHRFNDEGFERRGKPGSYRQPKGHEDIKRYYEPHRSFAEKPEYYGTRKGTFEDTREFRYTQQAVSFLNEASERKRPFLLCVNYNGPHPPYVTPAPFNRMYSPEQVQPPPNFLHRSEAKPRYQNDILWYWHDTGHLSGTDWRRMNSYYWGFLSMLDLFVGQLLDALEQTGVMEETMIVMAGDQGSMLGEHGLYDKGPYAYEELMRIPLLVRVPEAGGRTVERQVSIVDINETVVDWLGLRPGRGKRFSRSLLPLARGESGTWSGVADEAFYRYEWYNGKWYGIRTIRTPEWKYCWNPVGVDELYHLVDDPYELKNRISDPAAEGALGRLRGRLQRHLEETEDPLAERYREEYGL